MRVFLFFLLVMGVLCPALAFDSGSFSAREDPPSPDEGKERVRLFRLDGIPDPPAAAFTSAWARAKQAVELAQPQTARKRVEALIADTREAGHAAWALRVYLAMNEPSGDHYRVDLEPIRHLERAIPDWPEDLRPILQMMQGNMMVMASLHEEWDDDDEVEDPFMKDPGWDELESWSAINLRVEGFRRMEAVLAAGERFREVDVEELADLTTPGKLPNSFSPTVYDLLANQLHNAHLGVFTRQESLA